MAAPTPPPPPAAIPDHELLRPIGRGGYGEVWLARTVLGEFRAVKFVRREGPNDDRVVEREFEGLQKFEPISRAHEGLVHILHAGRFEDGFYYVMELADAAGGEPLEVAGSRMSGSQDSGPGVSGTKTGDPGAARPKPSNLEPGTYVPRTLRRVLKERRRLPVAECVGMGLKLADALVYLHGRGLVHRDLKPSNIIFVRGQPKLADIGLVASSDASMSCVGTEGYLPPEGPGKAPADIYALGKMIYEMATGQDRTEFPELPTLLREDAERAGLEELNEVILHACEPDASRRYATAVEMRADLELLGGGGSLQQRRVRKQRWAQARKLAALTVVLVALGIGIRSFSPESRRTEPLTPSPLAVEEFHAHFDVSPDGERIAFALPTDVLIWERVTSTTRRFDIRGAEGWLTPGNSGRVGMPRWAPDGRRLVFMPFRPAGGTVDGPTNVHAAFLLDATTGEARKIGPDWTEAERPWRLCWQPDGLGLAGCTRDLKFFTLLLTGERIPWAETEIPGAATVEVGGFSRDGRWLVVSDRQSGSWDRRDLWLVPRGGGTPIRLTDNPGFDADPVWGPEGDTVYFVSDGGLARNPTRGLWRLRIHLRTGAARGSPVEVLSKAGQQLARPAFVAGGTRLVYAVTEPDTRIVVADAGDLSRTNPVTRGQDPVLSPDGETVYFSGETPEQQGVFAIDRAGRTLPRRLGDIIPLAGGFPRSFLQVSPDGGLIALPGEVRGTSGLYLLSTTNDSSRLVERFPAIRLISPVWSPDGQWIAYAVDKELRRVSRDLKTREVLATLQAWDGWHVRWSPDGKHIAALAYGGPHHWHPLDETNHVFVFSLADRRLTRLTPESEDKYKEGLEWHPDSRRLTYFFNGPEKFSAKLKWAFVDRPGDTQEMIDQDRHWDYIGVWAPDGRHFHFTSSPDMNDHLSMHIFDLQTGDIAHGVRGGYRPEWSRDGRVIVWAAGKTKRYLEEIKGIPR